tara:strand:- start:404 stop:1003 length:600 start_codon:yes stop_codon:yes gene_type:complete
MDDLSLHLKKLTPVKPGDQPEDVLTAGRINAIQLALLLLATGANVKTAGGLAKSSHSFSYILKGAEPGVIDPEESVCELRMRSASDESGYKVTFDWGRVANRQPKYFNTRGMITPLDVADDGEIHYFYAKCTANLVTLAWTDAEIVEALPGDVATPTSTVVHYLLGTAEVVGGALSLSDPACGPVWPRLCDLASEYSYS